MPKICEIWMVLRQWGHHIYVGYVNIGIFHHYLTMS